MSNSANILQRVKTLRRNAAERYNIAEVNVHVGHMALQSMLEEPDVICQVRETLIKNKLIF